MAAHWRRRASLDMANRHTHRIAVSLGACLFVPALATAQSQQVSTPARAQGNVNWTPTPAPAATASGAAWQVDRDPVFFAGDWFDPDGSTVFFNGSVMIQSSSYRGVPLYVDATVDTYSAVYLPIGGHLMRTYTRRLNPRADRAAALREEPAVSTTVAPDTTAASRARVSVVKSANRRPTGEGIWIEFGGARWYSAGPAVTYSAGRFMLVGRSRGFPVYRENTGTASRVYIPATPDGLLAPYALN
jgi:hypothetical protein